MRPLAAALLSLAIASPAGAQAVGLEDPACASLPFDPDAMRAVFALELAVDGRRLADDDATVSLSWAPERCEAGATRYRIALRDERGRVREAVLDLADVPLGTLARAVALELIGLLGERPPPSSSGPHAVSDSASDSGSDSGSDASDSASDSGSDASDFGSDAAASDSASGAASAAAPDGAPEIESDSRPANSHGPIWAAEATVRNTPDTGAVLSGLRLALDLGIFAEFLGEAFPLLVRLDFAFAGGPASHHASLAEIEGGVTLAIRANAAPGVDMRFGPRLWLGYGWVEAAAPDGVGTHVSMGGEGKLFGAGLSVGLDVAVHPSVDLRIGGEVGTNIEGLQLASGSGTTGFTGAYWGLDVGLGFR